MFARGCLTFVLLLFSVDAAAQTAKTLTGRWSASTLRTSWTAEPWGDACGARPTATSEAGGIVSITQNGNELSLVGLGRTFASSSCWESIPNGRITSHAASNGAIRTVCQSPPGDSRRSTITTTLSLTENRIDFAEIGQFESLIGNDTCRAVMRRSRTYTLVEREGETRPNPNELNGPAPGLAIAEPPAQTVANPPNQDCSQPGPAHRIEVSPARKLLRAGETYVFRVRVLDKSACVLTVPVTWSLPIAVPSVEVTQQGQIKVGTTAAEGQVTVVAATTELKVKALIDIVSEARYQELLVAGTFDAEGATKESAVTTSVSSTVGAKTAVSETAAQQRRVLFVWIIGGLALILGLVASWLGLSRRKSTSSSIAAASLGESSPLVLKDDGVNGSLKIAAIWVCPTCHEEYGAEQKFCAIDGNRLIELPAQIHLAGAEGGICPVCRHGFDPGVARCPTHDEELVPAAALIESPANRLSTGRRICPVCGTLYGPETQFCGNDGAALVPIN